MKKFLALLLSTLFFVCSQAQTIRPNPLPNFQQFGTPQTLTRINGILYPAVGYAPAMYVDTATANANSYLKNIPFAQMSTSSDGKNWYRNYDATAWIELAGVDSWNLTGTNTGSNLFGVSDSNDIVFKTNAIERFRIKAAGNTHFKDTVNTNKIAAVPIAEPDYEIAIFPDIQNMVRWSWNYGRPMYTWLRDSAAYYNVKAMLQVGDITDWNTQAEWDTVAAWNAYLPTSFPVLYVPGNHDYGNGFNPSGRDATKYKTEIGAFNASRTYPYGYYNSSPENSYMKFDAGSKKYFVLGLEFLPRDAVVTWASDVLDSLYAIEPDREVIVVTHAHISQIGELAKDSSAYSGDTYGMSADNSGQELWDKLIRKKKNIKWVFSGHYLIPNVDANRGLTSRIVAVNDHGQLVNQIFINYQDDVFWGDGYMLRLKFKPAKGTVDASFYSAYYNAEDSRVASYTLEDPSVSLVSSMGVRSDLSVGRDFRVAGTAKFELLNPNRIPFSDSDHVLRDDANLRWNKYTQTLDVTGTVQSSVRHKTDTSEFNFGKQVSRINGKTTVQYGRGTGTAAIYQYVNDAFDITASNGNLYKNLVYINSTIDSGHKMFIGDVFHSYKRYQPVDGFTGSAFGSNIYRPEMASSFSNLWLLPKGSYTLNGAQDYPNSNVMFRANNGGMADTVNITYGSTVLTGFQNVYARQDFAPTILAYVNNYGMMSNYSSHYKLTRKANSNIDWLNHYAVAGTGGTDYGQVVKNMAGLYIEDMSTAFTRRLWGVLQLGTNELNGFRGKLFVGDTTEANAGSAKLFVDGAVRLKNLGTASTDTSRKIVTIDANGDVLPSNYTVGQAITGSGGGIDSATVRNLRWKHRNTIDYMQEYDAAITRWAGSATGAGSIANDNSFTMPNWMLDYLGAVQNATGTTTTGSAISYYGAPSSGAGGTFRNENTKNLSFEVGKVLFPVLSDSTGGTDIYKAAFGLFDWWASDITQSGIQVYYDRSSHGNYWAIRSDGGSVSTVVTTTPIEDSTRYTIRLEVSRWDLGNSGGSVRVYINDVEVVASSGTYPITTNIPYATWVGNPFYLGLYIKKSAGTNSRIMYADWTHIYAEILNR